MVDAAQDGTGYFVTRYDLDGTFTTIVGARNPGCNELGTFATAGTGTFNGVWTRFIEMNVDLDYNPDADLPPTATWDDVFTVFFGLPPGADPPTVSYEFDYYNACDDHWRDSFYAGVSAGSGNIADCP